jgi:hypothetical protein
MQIKFVKKAFVFFRLFPYLSPNCNPKLTDLYIASIQKASIQFKILYWLSVRYQRVCEKVNIAIKRRYSSVFDYEIEILHKKRADFLYQNHVLHLFNDGTQSQKDIINDKNKFHNFCKKHNLPAAQKIGELKNGHLQNMTALPWETAEDFLVKPTIGSKSVGILDFRAIGNNKYEILDENREIDSKNIAQYLAYFLPKGDFIIQKRLLPPTYLQQQDLAHVPIIRILSCKSGNDVSIINPVLILNVEKKYLNPYLSNKVFYAINASDGKILEQIHFSKNTEPSNYSVINTLPDWDTLTKTIQKAHALLGGIRLIGWDVALSSTGYAIIEANKSPWLEIHQKAPFDSPYFLEKVMSLSSRASL